MQDSKTWIHILEGSLHFTTQQMLLPGQIFYLLKRGADPTLGDRLPLEPALLPYTADARWDRPGHCGALAASLPGRHAR